MKFHPPGTRIAGRYEVAGRPLLGGMGIVYLCHDRQEDRALALKTFKPEYLPDPAARERFLQEGSTWVELGAHPHIVRCHQVLRLDDGREVYLVLELVTRAKGRADASLRSWLVPGQPLPADQALLFALQIARGMVHATATLPGFVHRDLKPENLLVGHDPLPGSAVNRLRVTDFGLVRALTTGEVVPSAREGEQLPERPGLTRAGMVLGTPGYMAPEQWLRPDVDLRADVYALGCILGEMLVGRPLIRERTFRGFRQAHRAGLAAQAVAGLPESLAGMLAGCLAMDPQDRYATWADVEAALVAAYERTTGQSAPTASAMEKEGGRADRVAAGLSYNDIGAAYLDIGRAEAALPYLERGRQVGRAEGEGALEALALGNLGVSHTRLGNAQQAVTCLQQALALWRETGNRWGESSDLVNLGNTYLQLGDARQALGYYETALQTCREIGNQRGERLALSSLGSAYFHLGDARRALGCYEQCLALARRIGDRRGEGESLSSLGWAYTRLGDARQAIGYYEQALAVHREIADRYAEGNNLDGLGQACAALGDAGRAIGYYQQALAIQRETGDRQGEMATLSDLGSVYTAVGDAQRAIRCHEQALVLAREVGDRRGEGSILANLASACATAGDSDRAIKCWQQAGTLLESVGYLLGSAVITFNLGVFLVQQRRPAEALPYVERSARAFVELGQAQYAQQAQELLAQIRHALGRR
jgi:tetratricopeptide (TPR) repeat protein